MTKSEGISLASLLSMVCVLFLPGCFFSPPECELCADPKEDLCIPAEALGPPPDACGTFVSSTADAGGDGSKSKPLRSLAEAFAGAGPGANVYACGEVFDEAVTMPAGVRLYGGLDCKNGFWYAPDTARTEIAPRAPGVALVVGHGDGKTRIVDVRIVAAPAVEPGSSSIAVLVDQADVAFVRTTLVAGDAADGSDGEPFSGPAPSGKDGAPGAGACTADDVFGGLPVTTLCDRANATGGKGGDGGLSKGQDGDDGAPVTVANHGNGQPENDAAGGCTDGQSGPTGVDGAAGLGGGHADKGWIGIFGYLGVHGDDGEPGAVAQGGGGGGGAKGGAGPTGCSGLTAGGASGGSGGGGGCGGLGGRGGMAGGASIALVSLWPARLGFEKVTLSAGRGGHGGAGGKGQPGGKGGVGAAGGSASAQLLPACAGGDGGHGGTGGRGGGGAGGHSVGIAFTGVLPTLSGADVSVAAFGKGGAGDDETGNGGDGVSAATLDMDP